MSRLSSPACLSASSITGPHVTDKSVVRALAKDSAWVRNHENIFVNWTLRVGKSFLASALAQKACRDGHSVLYLRAAACCVSWPWPEPMAACATSWLDSVASMFWLR